MWKTDDPEMVTPKRVRTYRPKHSDTSLSREWRIDMANKKKKKIIRLHLFDYQEKMLIRTTSGLNQFG